MRSAQCWSLGCQAAVWLREIERPHLLAQDFRVEERFGFDSHLPGDRLCAIGKKPSGFLLDLNVEHRTPNIGPLTLKGAGTHCLKTRQRAASFPPHISLVTAPDTRRTLPVVPLARGQRY